jgi:hypothetical protein
MFYPSPIFYSVKQKVTKWLPLYLLLSKWPLFALLIGHS